MAPNSLDILYFINLSLEIPKIKWEGDIEVEMEDLLVVCSNMDQPKLA
jgi:hypothetical protein